MVIAVHQLAVQQDPGAREVGGCPGSCRLGVLHRRFLATSCVTLMLAFMEEVLAEQFGVGTIERILDEQRGAIAGTMDAWERAKRVFS